MATVKEMIMKSLEIDRIYTSKSCHNYIQASSHLDSQGKEETRKTYHLMKESGSRDKKDQLHPEMDRGSSTGRK